MSHDMLLEKIGIDRNIIFGNDQDKTQHFSQDIEQAADFDELFSILAQINEKQDLLPDNVLDDLHLKFERKFNQIRFLV